MEDYSNSMTQADRDLLIIIKTKMERVEADVRELKDTTAKRVDTLESDKLSSKQAEQWKEEADALHGDHENRLRFIERYVWGAVSILGLVNFIGFGTVIWFIQNLNK